MTMRMFSPRAQPPAARTKTRPGRVAILVILLMLVLAYGAYRRSVRNADANRPLPGDVTRFAPCTVWFVGSSSFAYWKQMPADMLPWHAINRGVAGADTSYLAHRIAEEGKALRPDAIVVYAGENDIANGNHVADVIRNYGQLIEAIDRDAPDVPIIAMPVKPTPTRFPQRPQQIELNAFIRTLMMKHGNLNYVDPNAELMVNGAFGPYYLEDGIHLNEAGHRLWSRHLHRALADIVPEGGKDCAGADRSG